MIPDHYVLAILKSVSPVIMVILAEVDMSVLDPMVRRILSAETSDNWDLIKYHEETIMERVRRYPGFPSRTYISLALRLHLCVTNFYKLP